MSRDLHRTVSDAPVRLDKFLRAWLGERLGRRRIAAMVAAGGVRVNARRAAKGMILRAGDVVTVDAPPAAPPLAPTPVPLPIVHADAALVAVDKPAGMPSFGGTVSPSVASALLATYPEMAAIDPVRGAGLVHRLDTGTSGLLIAARDPATYRRLRAELQAKRVEKEYLALVAGRVASAGRVEQRLRRRQGTRARMEPTAAGDGWPAETEYAPLWTDGTVTLLRLRMRTGVTHQLRVHLALIGHPVLGDARYGGDAASAIDPGYAGHCLHARAVTFDASDLPTIATPFPGHWGGVCTRIGCRPEDLAAALG